MDWEVEIERFVKAKDIVGMMQRIQQMREDEYERGYNDAQDMISAGEW